MDPTPSFGSSVLRSTEDPKKGVEIADNETLMLNTLIRSGVVSFQPGDVKYRYPDLTVPEFIKKSAKFNSARKVDSFVICDEHGNLRDVGKLGVFNNTYDNVMKVIRKITH